MRACIVTCTILIRSFSSRSSPLIPLKFSGRFCSHSSHLLHMPLYRIRATQLSLNSSIFMLDRFLCPGLDSTLLENKKRLLESSIFPSSRAGK